ncbi:MAG: hypothetical protein JSS81_29455 [Acidobacteria bacterium]|nr:hypothetical protein [Acidobacteriota bacterium]
MYLQTTKNAYQTEPPPVSNDYFYRGQTGDRLAAGAEFETAAGVDLPILATANDLREAVKFFKHKPQGVSAIELTSAEPRRVFETRKLAAYEFWGVIGRAGERFLLTALGEEMAKNTEAECLIHRRILRAVEAYRQALEWIAARRLQIATYLDVAQFWQQAGDALELSAQTDENIEAVIVSFFSLCHAAELGTATVGKRGQPARLSVSLDRLRAFLDAPDEQFETMTPAVVSRPAVYPFEKMAGENIRRVYIAAGARAPQNLRAALELADFESVAFAAGKFANGFLPADRRAAMRDCQAAVFLLDEGDLCPDSPTPALRCDRVTEISVAEALFGERLLVYWNGREAVPPLFAAAGFQTIGGDALDWESNVRLVRALKSLKG